MNNQNIMIISLWQPWASLCVWDEKQFETRHWQTPYRGILAIHAAKRFTADERITCRLPYFGEALLRNGINTDLSNLPLGAIVGSVILTKIWKTESLTGGMFGDFCLTDKEETFGNYDFGRFAWKLENPVSLQEPISLRGQQGLWTAPAEVRDLIISSRQEVAI